MIFVDFTNYPFGSNVPILFNICADYISTSSSILPNRTVTYDRIVSMKCENPHRGIHPFKFNTKGTCYIP